MSSQKLANQLVANFMNAMVSLQKHLKRGRPLTALQVESISTAHGIFGAFLDAWKLQHGYTRRRWSDKSPRSWFADTMVAKKSVNRNPAAVALGRLGGLKGGIARAKKLSAAKRVAIAKRAIAARWARATAQN